MSISASHRISSANKPFRILVTTFVVLTLSGCLISPYSGQKLSSRSATVPFTVYTVDKTKPITIECAQASAHGNPYNGNGSYQLVKTVWPASQGMLDPSGTTIYSASTEESLPAECFRFYNYSDEYDYITVIRVLQDGSDSQIYTFDKAGLACLGEWVGKGPNWLHWLGKGCHRVYSNTGNVIRTVMLRAKP